MRVDNRKHLDNTTTLLIYLYPCKYTLWQIEDDVAYRCAYVPPSKGEENREQSQGNIGQRGGALAEVYGYVLDIAWWKKTQSK